MQQWQWSLCFCPRYQSFFKTYQGACKQYDMCKWAHILLYFCSPENGEVNVWEEINQALKAKKEELSQEDNWNKTQSSGRRPWSYKALRGSALGPTMALLRSQNELWALCLGKLPLTFHLFVSRSRSQFLPSAFRMFTVLKKWELLRAWLLYSAVEVWTLCKSLTSVYYHFFWPTYISF